MDFNDALELLGYLLRVVGALVFGLGSGWLAVQAFQSETQIWQLQTAAFFGLLAAFVLLGRWVENGGATLGAFGLGAGAGLLIWGLTGSRKLDESE